MKPCVLRDHTHTHTHARARATLIHTRKSHSALRPLAPQFFIFPRAVLLVFFNTKIHTPIFIIKNAKVEIERETSRAEE